MRPQNVLGFALMVTITLANQLRADQTYVCEGTAPDWQLDLAPDTAQFRLPLTTPARHFDIPQHSSAEGHDWPQAFTLIADFDTAIVVLDAAQCGDMSLRAHILTQRGETPILLTGCCRTLP